MNGIVMNGIVIQDIHGSFTTNLETPSTLPAKNFSSISLSPPNQKFCMKLWYPQHITLHMKNQ